MADGEVPGLDRIGGDYGRGGAPTSADSIRCSAKIPPIGVGFSTACQPSHW